MTTFAFVAHAPSRVRTGQDLLEANLAFYDPLWKQSRLVSPDRFNTWPLVQSLLAQPQSRLEVGPGLRPRFPLKGTRFVDASLPAVDKLRRHGASAEVGLVSSIPFDDGMFNLVGAFDIVEHVDDDDAALSELSRVSAPMATVLLSAPLHPSRWTKFDDLVGHRRRYEPGQLVSKLAHHRLSVIGTAVYGMQPRSSLLLDFGVWGLTHRRDRAIWWYDRVMLQLGARFQKKLVVVPGMMDVTNVDEILLACRKIPAEERSDRAAPREDIDEDHGDGQHQQKVNEGTPDVKRNETQKPHHKEQYGQTP